MPDTKPLINLEVSSVFVLQSPPLTSFLKALSVGSGFQSLFYEISYCMIVTGGRLSVLENMTHFRYGDDADLQI